MKNDFPMSDTSSEQRNKRDTNRFRDRFLGYNIVIPLLIALWWSQLDSANHRLFERIQSDDYDSH